MKTINLIKDHAEGKSHCCVFHIHRGLSWFGWYWSGFFHASGHVTTWIDMRTKRSNTVQYTNTSQTEQCNLYICIYYKNKLNIVFLPIVIVIYNWKLLYLFTYLYTFWLFWHCVFNCDSHLHSFNCIFVSIFITLFNK